MKPNTRILLILEPDIIKNDLKLITGIVSDPFLQRILKRL